MKNTYPNTINSLKIKEQRQKTNLTTEFIAVQMGISLRDYIKIEEGTKDIKLSKFILLSQILGIKKSAFFKKEIALK